jgi:hypothetical protein
MAISDSFGDRRFELVERSRIFIPEDNPAALVSLLASG